MNKNSQTDNQKYRQLIQRMENRRNKVNQHSNKVPKNAVYIISNPKSNIPSMPLHSQQSNYQTNSNTNTSNFNKNRYYPIDDYKLKNLPLNKPDFNKLPNSAKNYKQLQQQKAVQQQYFKKNRLADKQANKQNLQTQGNNQDKDNSNNNPQNQDKKITKQFHQFLYKKHNNNQQKNQTNVQYEKLHQKLDNIESKISQMKISLQKKKQQKLKMLQMQKKKKLQIQTEEIQQKSLGGYVTQVHQHKQVHAFNTNPYSPMAHNIYYVSQIVRAYKEEKSLAREHLYTSVQIFRMLQNAKKLSDQEMLSKRIQLPRRKGYQDKKTVVFDLDQTLIHCNESLNVKYDVKLPIKFPTGEIIEAGINIRPYCKKILQQLSKKFEIIIFTASHSCYASVVLDYLDPNGQYIHHRLFRQHCHATPQGVYIKDLRIINRTLSEMILIDNAAYSYAFQIDNGIPILPYYHGSNDYELQTLQRYIEKMILADDVRKLNRNTFKFHQYPNYYDDPQKLVQDLYFPQR